MKAATNRLAVSFGWGLVLVAFFSVGSYAQQQTGPPQTSTLQIGQSSRSSATPAAEPQMQQSSLPLDYTIGPEDVLEISVFDVPELSKLTVRVTNDGTIPLPLLGDVKAAGHTPQQLRDALEKDWGKTYLENPHVMVFVKEFHAQPVSVVGAVEKPGLYQLTGPRTLIEVISLAGGFSRTGVAPGRSLYVSRQGGFGGLAPAEGMRLVAPDKLEVNIDRLLYSRENALNIPIRPQDIITVSKAQIVYVVGAVKKSGGFVIGDKQQQLTVLQALALAEGLTPNAAKRKAVIIHTNDDGKRTEVKVDLEKILKGKGSDPELAANDILFVPDSATKAGLKKSLDTAVAMATGVVIWRL
jgi:polysaccharide export outer membrane protein